MGNFLQTTYLWKTIKNWHRCFSREDTQRANKYMKKSSAALIIRKMHIKT